MRKPLCLPLMLLALLALAAGCSSTKTAREKMLYEAASGSYTDMAARDTYVTRRTKELVNQGVKPLDAASRASSEWFSRAPAVTTRPTAYEKARRAEEAKIVTYLEKQKDADAR